MKRGIFLLAGILSLIGLVFAALRQQRAVAKTPVPANSGKFSRPDNPLNYGLADSVSGLLRNGDVVLRCGADATSCLLRQLNRQDRRFSHCGIVLVERDTPFVYHSIGGEDNPDARLRRESAARFFSPRGNERIGIVRLDLAAAQLAALQAIVRGWHREGRLFDMDFDLASDGRLYCAEMVYKSVRLAAGDTAYFPLSRLQGRSYVGVDNLFLNRHARLICDVQYH